MTIISGEREHYGLQSWLKTIHPLRILIFLETTYFLRAWVISFSGFKKIAHSKYSNLMKISSQQLAVKV
jgi:hypothetical protein